MIEIDWQLLSITTASAAGILLVTMLFYLLQRLKTRVNKMQQQLSTLTKELQILSRSGRAVDEHIEDLQKLFEHASKRQKYLDQTDVENSHYAQATKMLSLGADINEVIACCGLSKGEAELVQALSEKRISTSL